MNKRRRHKAKRNRVWRKKLDTTNALIRHFKRKGLQVYSRQDIFELGKMLHRKFDEG